MLAFPLMRLLAPDGHLDPAIPALQILAPSVFLLFVNNAFIYTLTAINRQLDFTRLSLVTLVVNVVLNLALIPGYGLLGAAAASTLTELALFTGGWWQVGRSRLRLPIITAIGRLIVGAAIMGVVLYVIRLWPLWLVVPIGAAVYAVSLVVLRAIDAEEWSILRSGLTARRTLP